MAKYLIGLLLLVGVAIGTNLIVNHYRLPGQSNMISSMAMDMTLMKPPLGTVPVGTAPVVMRRIQPEVTYSGTIRGFNEIPLAARIDGTIAYMPVYVGSKVTKGQLLVQLDAPERQAQTQIAHREKIQSQQELAVMRQETIRLKAQIQAAAAEIQAAQAALKAAQANQAYWRERLPRERTLYEAGGISQEEYQGYQAEAEGVESSVIAAQQRLNAAIQERHSRQALAGENRLQQRFQQARIQQAQSVIQERQVWQSFARLTAPWYGVITKRLQAPGALVSASTPILTLAQTDRVRIQVQVPETDYSELEVGGLLTFSTAARPNDEIETHITSIAPASEPSSRTHLVEAIVDNPEGHLLPGQYVKARLRSGAPQPPQPAVPERAVLQIQGQDAVWTVRHGRAHLVMVTVAAYHGDWAVVPELPKGMTVITDGYESLTESMAVTPVRWGENGPERLPDAGGRNRLTQQNRWTWQTKLSENLVFKVTISPQPPVAGTNTLRFELRHNGQHPLTDARIQLMTSMPTMNMAGPQLTAVYQPAGHYEATFSGMSGLWQVMATVETEDKRLQPFAFEFNVP